MLERVARSGARAPGLLWAEVRNVLVMAERRGRIAQRQADAALTELEALRIELDHVPDSRMTLRLARRHRVSVYDALYLELAIREGRALATLDQALRAAADSEGIEVRPGPDYRPPSTISR